MWRRVLKLLSGLLLVASLGWGAINLVTLARNPLAGLLLDRSRDAIAAVLAPQLARRATPAELASLVTEALDDEPRNWLVINALTAEAAHLGIVLPDDLTKAVDAAHAEDNGLLQTTGQCLACGWDPANCSLSAILLCRAPVDLTPVGDVAGVVRETANYARGAPVDSIDLTLSAIGLGAVALAPTSAGTTLAVKIGATTLKTTRKIGNVTPQLTRVLSQTSERAIKWDDLRVARPRDIPDVLRRAVDPAELRPVFDTLSSMGDMRVALGIPSTLHVMKYVTSPQDALRSARVADAMGPRTVAAFEVLGRNRVLRAAVRYSDEALGLIWSAFGAVTALLGLIGSTLGNRFLRRILRAL